MILLKNIFITDTHVKGKGTYQNREYAKNFDKLDIYKYSLASIAKIYPWKKVIINTKLDGNYKHREKELTEFIEKEFASREILIRNYRNETQKQWQEEGELLDDDLIWLNGNHDHVFIDNNYNYFQNYVDNARNLKGKFSLQFSHWPEFVNEPFDFGKQAYFDGKLLKLNGRYHHSLQIVSKDLYNFYWNSVKLPEDQIWGRTDNFISDIFEEDIETYVPLRELCRHFDGYQHCAVPYVNQVCPVLEIPDGFFRNNIKINYSNEYVDGKTNLNPLNTSLKIFNQSGADFWYSLNFMPIFWRDKISEITNTFAGNIDETTLDIEYIKRQLLSIYRMPDSPFKQAIINGYLYDKPK